MENSRREEGFFSSISGKSLYYRAWIPESPKWILLISHGLGEHGGRYEHMATFFCERGAAVFAPDHLGHGRSEGKRGHVPNFHYFALDLEQLRVELVSRMPDLPIVLFGHSMGGAAALDYALSFQERLTAVILSAPALGLRMKTPKLQVKAADFLARIFPSLTLDNKLSAEWLSHDPQVVEAYRNDPLVHPKISAALFTGMTAVARQCLQAADQLKLPVLVIFGGQDPIVSFDAVRSAFEKFSSSDKKLLFYEKDFHEVHNDLSRMQEFQEIWLWLKDKVNKS
ncbi:MAG: lysophospholipase [candidate division KSB1 bacterium]|nr:lysophospholipase [candidate division KSB1 bacterium]MDZ7345455.1 lysophospholipase [candidate division KSB1 bacterium]